MATHHPFERLATHDPKSGDLNIVVDTPKGSRNKFVLDEDLGLFRLGGVLPAGAVFPYDFGFVPRTLGGDGDPLDVLVLMDEPAFVGCLISARLVGVIEADQTEGGETTRNDRLIAVSTRSHNHHDIEELDQFNANLVAEVEHFFVSYNLAKGKEFKPLGRHGAERARRVLAEGADRYEAEHAGKSPDAPRPARRP